MLPYILVSLLSVTFSAIPSLDAPKEAESVQSATIIPSVPFYSQFRDISSPKWQKVGCGITSLVMVIDFYKPDAVTVNVLLRQGIDDGAYIQNVGWSHQGLILLSQKYELKGKAYDLSGSSNAAAFTEFKKLLEDGPIIVSVHYKMDPENPIPHLVVVNGIDGDTLSYNDPAEKTAEKEIAGADFLKAWKKRFIVIRPSPQNRDMAQAKEQP